MTMIYIICFHCCLLLGMLSFELEGFFELQIGILVGKLAVVSSVRDLVFALIPTPATDGEEAAKMTPPLPSDPKGSKEGGGSSRKGGGKKGKTAVDSSSSLTVDSEWVAEHARQVQTLHNTTISQFTHSCRSYYCLQTKIPGAMRLTD
jgi:hypothetical protein